MITRQCDKIRISDIVRNIYVESKYSFRGFYKGYIISILMAVPFNSMIWTIYWHVQSQLENLAPKQNSSTTAMISAAIASTSACIMTQPIDVLKTRYQVAVEHQPLWKTLSLLIQERGWTGLFSGTIPRACIIVPYSLVMMSMYEAIKRSSTIVSNDVSENEHDASKS